MNKDSDLTVDERRYKRLCSVSYREKYEHCKAKIIRMQRNISADHHMIDYMTQCGYFPIEQWEGTDNEWIILTCFTWGRWNRQYFYYILKYCRNINYLQELRELRREFSRMDKPISVKKSRVPQREYV